MCIINKSPLYARFHSTKCDWSCFSWLAYLCCPTENTNHGSDTVSMHLKVNVNLEIRIIKAFTLTISKSNAKNTCFFCKFLKVFMKLWTISVWNVYIQIDVSVVNVYHLPCHHKVTQQLQIDHRFERVLYKSIHVIHHDLYGLRWFAAFHHSIHV